MKTPIKSSCSSTENKLSLLTKENSSLQTENSFLHNENNQLKEQLNWFTNQLFGKKSERIISDTNSEQLTFEGFENQQQKVEEETIAAHKRCKPNRTGSDKITLSPDLPVETTILDIPEKQKICCETGKPLVKVGEEVSFKLAHKPGSYYIKEIIRPKYALSEGGILTADLPNSIRPKCRAEASFLAEVLTKKFADHLPLYRISEIIKREGVGISRKLLSQWVVKLGVILKPLKDEMLKRILENGNIFVDETPVKFLEKESKLGYLWTICGGRSSDPPYRVYDFRENRKHNNILDLLKDYHGVMHSDAYGAYSKLAENKSITWCPCWAHVRRKFFEVESGDLLFRDWVLEEIQKLFKLEEGSWLLPEEERVKIREEKEEPIINELTRKIQDKLINGRVLPKSKLKKALGYYSSLIPYLKNYLKQPFARLDNNVAERAIRPIALGRKNWLFFGSSNGGKSGAVILSLVQTCRGLGINPREYLEDILRRFMEHNFKKIHELLPDQWLLNKK